MFTRRSNGSLVRHLAGIMVFWSAVGTVVAQESEEKSASAEQSLQSTAEGIANLELMQRGLATEGGAASTGGLNGLPSSLGKDETLSTSSGALGLSGTTTDQAAQDEWVRQNWLLSGLHQLEQETQQQGTEIASEAALVAPDEQQAIAGSADYWLQLMGEGAADGEDDTTASAVVQNPLDSFMTGWLSSEPNLAPATETELSAILNSAQAATGTDAFSDLSENSPGAGISFGSAQQTGSSTVGTPADRENPYLADLGLPQSGTTWELPGLENQTGQGSGGDFQAPVLTPNPAPTGSTPLPGTTTPPTNTDNSWRPPAREDDKYFRRLNRF